MWNQVKCLPSPWNLVNGAQSTQKDKFETLYHIDADISSSPYTSRFTTDEGMSYRRRCDVILLVGLTELKAQVSWIDSETVRAAFSFCESRSLPVIFTLILFPSSCARECRGRRKGFVVVVL